MPFITTNELVSSIIPGLLDFHGGAQNSDPFANLQTIASGIVTGDYSFLFDPALGGAGSPGDAGGSGSSPSGSPTQGSTGTTSGSVPTPADLAAALAQLTANASATLLADTLLGGGASSSSPSLVGIRQTGSLFAAGFGLGFGTPSDGGFFSIGTDTGSTSGLGRNGTQDQTGASASAAALTNLLQQVYGVSGKPAARRLAGLDTVA